MTIILAEDIEYLDGTPPYAACFMQLDQQRHQDMDDTMDQLDVIEQALRADEVALRTSHRGAL